MSLAGVRNVYVLFIPGFFIMAAVGMINVMVTVFLANTVDYGELKNNRRDESVIFSMQTFVVKLASGIAALVASICLTVFNIQEDSAGAATVSIDKTAIYSIADTMMIPLKVGEDGKNHYYQVNVALSLNMEDEGYKKYFEGMAEKEDLIKAKIIDVIGGHTLEELQVDQEGVKAEVLSALQALYNSSFIYQVSFSNVLFQ